jgi:hypothetical protein
VGVYQKTTLERKVNNKGRVWWCLCDMCVHFYKMRGGVLRNVTAIYRHS